MKIRIDIEGTPLTATLDDGAASRDFAYSAGLVKLGRVDAGVEALQRPGTLRVSIERIEP